MAEDKTLQSIRNEIVLLDKVAGKNSKSGHIIENLEKIVEVVEQMTDMKKDFSTVIKNLGQLKKNNLDQLQNINVEEITDLLEAIGKLPKDIDEKIQSLLKIGETDPKMVEQSATYIKRMAQIKKSIQVFADIDTKAIANIGMKVEVLTNITNKDIKGIMKNIKSLLLLKDDLQAISEGGDFEKIKAFAESIDALSKVNVNKAVKNVDKLIKKISPDKIDILNKNIEKLQGLKVDTNKKSQKADGVKPIGGANPEDAVIAGAKERIAERGGASWQEMVLEKLNIMDQKLDTIILQSAGAKGVDGKKPVGGSKKDEPEKKSFLSQVFMLLSSGGKFIKEWIFKKFPTIAKIGKFIGIASKVFFKIGQLSLFLIKKIGGLGLALGKTLGKALLKLPFIQTLKNLPGKIFGSLKNVGGAIWGMLKSGLSKLPFIGKFFSGGAGAKSIGGTIGGAIGGAKEKIAGAAGSIFSKVKSFGSSIASKTGALVKGPSGAVKFLSRHSSKILLGFGKVAKNLLKRIPVLSSLFALLEAGSITGNAKKLLESGMSPREVALQTIPRYGNVIGELMGAAAGFAVPIPGATIAGTLAGRYAGGWFAEKYAPEIADMLGFTEKASAKAQMDYLSKTKGAAAAGAIVKSSTERVGQIAGVAKTRSDTIDAIPQSDSSVASKIEAGWDAVKGVFAPTIQNVQQTASDGGAAITHGVPEGRKVDKSSLSKVINMMSQQG